MRKPAELHRRGAATVELALLLPFLVFLFAASADYGRVFYFSQVLTDGARMGAIYLSDPSAPVANLYLSVNQAVQATTGDLNPSPTVTSTSGTDSDGNSYVRVTVTWQFNTVMGFPGVPNKLLTRSCQMRVPRT